MFSRFDSIPVCDGQTDDRHLAMASALCIALRGENFLETHCGVENDASAMPPNLTPASFDLDL